MENAELALDVAENATTGELRVSLSVKGIGAILLATPQAKELLLSLGDAISYIEANQKLKELPDNVVQLKH